MGSLASYPQKLAAISNELSVVAFQLSASKIVVALVYDQITLQVYDQKLTKAYKLKQIRDTQKLNLRN